LSPFCDVVDQDAERPWQAAGTPLRALRLEAFFADGAGSGCRGLAIDALRQ